MAIPEGAVSDWSALFIDGLGDTRYEVTRIQGMRQCMMLIFQTEQVFVRCRFLPIGRTSPFIFFPALMPFGAFHANPLKAVVNLQEGCSRITIVQ